MCVAPVQVEREREHVLLSEFTAGSKHTFWLWVKMTNWLQSLWRCCSRRRPVREVQVLDPENQEQDLGFHRPHRRTYYYSIFAARLAIMVCDLRTFFGSLPPLPMPRL